MARRKRQAYDEAIRSKMKKEELPMLEWKTAIYARLSVENSNKNDDGESIAGQIEICKDYIEEHPYLNLVKVYSDNGWTGTNTNRPQFQQLLDDISSGKIKALVIKDFSRFSRDYIEAGDLLENVFPFMGVRFISVVDNYDSFETDGTSESLLIPLKNLINSYYSKDISKKVSTAVHSKQLAGEHIPSMIPYGYKKSTTRAYRFEVDEETSPIVKRIFKLRSEGTPISRIVKILNDEGIPSPGKLRYLRGMTKDSRYKNSLWSEAVIKQIHQNPTYLGHLVFGRMPTALYLGKPKYSYEPDESKWRILENMHEPLVDQDTFDKIKEMRERDRKIWHERHKKNTKQRESNQPFFVDRIYCGDCGMKMLYHRYSTLSTHKKSGTYECKNYRHRKCFSPHGINQDKLKKCVWYAIKTQIDLFCNLEKVMELLFDDEVETKQQKELKSELQSILIQMKTKQVKRGRLYEDFSDGILTAQEYQMMKKKYDEEYHALTSQYNSLLVSQRKVNKALSKENKWFLHMQPIIEAKEITQEIVEAVVDKVLIYQVDKEKRVEVKFKFQEDYHVLADAYEELIGGKEQ